MDGQLGFPWSGETSNLIQHVQSIVFWEKSLAGMVSWPWSAATLKSSQLFLNGSDGQLGFPWSGETSKLIPQNQSIFFWDNPLAAMALWSRKSWDPRINEVIFLSGLSYLNPSGICGWSYVNAVLDLKIDSGYLWAKQNSWPKNDARFTTQPNRDSWHKFYRIP